MPSPRAGATPSKAASRTRIHFVYREPPRSAAAGRKTIPMIDFYALTSPNVQKIFIMLEENAGCPTT